MNAKTQRPGVCNAAETLLVHEAIAEALLPRIAGALSAAGVSLRVDARTHEILTTQAGAGDVSAANGAASASGELSANGAAPAEGVPVTALAQATEEDWATEYLALTLAVGVVDSVEQAIEHISRYGSGTPRRS